MKVDYNVYEGDKWSKMKLTCLQSVKLRKSSNFAPKEPRDQELKALGTMEGRGMKTGDLIKSI